MKALRKNKYNILLKGQSWGACKKRSRLVEGQEKKEQAG